MVVKTNGGELEINIWHPQSMSEALYLLQQFLFSLVYSNIFYQTKLFFSSSYTLTAWSMLEQSFQWLTCCIYMGKHHCEKSVQIRSYFWYLFSCIRTEYGEILRISPFQSECGKIPTRNNSLFGHFSRSARVRENPCSRLFYAVITSWFIFASQHFSFHYILWFTQKNNGAKIC